MTGDPEPKLKWRTVRQVVRDKLLFWVLCEDCGARAGLKAKDVAKEVGGKTEIVDVPFKCRACGSRNMLIHIGKTPPETEELHKRLH